MDHEMIDCSIFRMKKKNLKIDHGMIIVFLEWKKKI